MKTSDCKGICRKKASLTGWSLYKRRLVNILKGTVTHEIIVPLIHEKVMAFHPESTAF